MSKRFPQRSSHIENNSNLNELTSNNSQGENSETIARSQQLQNLVDTHNPRRMRNSYPDTYSQISSSSSQKISPQSQVRRLSSIILQQRTSNEEFTNYPLRVSTPSPESPKIISSMARLRPDQTSKTEPPLTPQGLLRQLVRSIQTEMLVNTSSTQEVIRDNPKGPISHRQAEYSKQIATSDSSSESHLTINFDDIDTSANNHKTDKLGDKFSNLAPIDLDSIENIEEFSNLNINNQTLRDISIDLPSTSNNMGFRLSVQNELEDAQELLNNSLILIEEDLELLFPSDALPTPERNTINISDQLDTDKSSINISIPLDNSLIGGTELSQVNDFNLPKFDEDGSSYQNQQILDLSDLDAGSLDSETNDNVDQKSMDIANSSSSNPKLESNHEEDEEDLSMLERAFIEDSNDRSERSLRMDYSGEIDSDIDEKTQIDVSTHLPKLDLEDAADNSEYPNEDQILFDTKLQSTKWIDKTDTTNVNSSVPEHEIEPENETLKQNSNYAEPFEEFNFDPTDINIESNFSSELNKEYNPEIESNPQNLHAESVRPNKETNLDSDHKTTDPSLNSESEKEGENDAEPDDIADQLVESEPEEGSEADTAPPGDLIQTPSVSSEPSESGESSDLESVNLQPVQQYEDEDEVELPSEIEIIGTADLTNLNLEADNSTIIESNEQVDLNVGTSLINEVIDNEEATTAQFNNLDLISNFAQDETLLSVNPPISPDISFTNNLGDFNNENEVVDQEVYQSDLSEGSIDNIRQGTSKPILSPVSPGTTSTIHKLPTHYKQRKIDFNRVSKSAVSLNNLPASQVKSLVESMTNSRISSATLNSFLFATDKYFEQVSGDLFAYAKHAQRKIVNEEDLLCLFKRQNKIKNSEMSDWITLAQKQLPRDLWEPLAQPTNPTKRRKTN